ncbi:hypothetical protein HK405_009848, partial [Cladochytrium tenue]
MPLEAADAVGFAEMLVRADARLGQLCLEDTAMTAELVAGLTPLVSRVTRLEWVHADRFAEESEGFPALFRGRLAHLTLGTWSTARIRSIIMGNKCNLRTLKVYVNRPQTVGILLDYFDAQPPLSELHLMGNLADHGTELALAAPETIEALGLELGPGVLVGLFLSRLRNLKTLWLNTVDDDSDALSSPPSSFPVLRELRVLCGDPCYFTNGNYIDEIVTCCPNLKNLELRGRPGRLLSLRRLERLRTLTVRTSLVPKLDDIIIMDIIDLLDRPHWAEIGAELPVVLKAFLQFTQTPDLSCISKRTKYRAARAIADQSGGRIV